MHWLLNPWTFQRRTAQHFSHNISFYQICTSYSHKKNQIARTTVDALFHNFIVHYGIPQKIHSDQGANFMSHLIKELCTLTGTKKSRTTPYHSMGNGMTERFNRTLLEMLGTLEPEKKKHWKAHVGPLVLFIKDRIIYFIVCLLNE